MDEKEFVKLVNNYINGEATKDQMALLEQWYADIALKNNNEIVASDIEKAVPRIWQRVIQNTGIKQPAALFNVNAEPLTNEPAPAAYPFYKKAWLWTAAAVLVCFGVFYLLNINRENQHTTPRFAVVNKPLVNPVTNHFIALADGSKVILHGNSRLTVAPGFNKTGTREVSLIGEAYFDIRHMTKTPFIIHTGHLKTTVLGTAFVIKAYPAQKNITVTVTRGRVKVENERVVLGILNHGQQLTALQVKQTKDKPAIIQQVDMQNILQWAGEDMHFDALPFRELANQLEQHYAVHISFKNPELGSCPISGKFTGTESLKEVLDIVSQTRNATYTINNSQVIIDGKGCN